MLLQQPIRLPGELYGNGYICAPAVPAVVAHGVVAHGVGCNKAASRVEGFIHWTSFAEIADIHAAETRIQPNYIAKWPTLCRQLPVMPC